MRLTGARGWQDGHAHRSRTGSRRPRLAGRLRHVTKGVTSRLAKAAYRNLSPHIEIQAEDSDFRYTAEVALDELKPQARGLLITLDELHTAGRGQMREIAVAVQHLQRDGRDVAFVFAGLPTPVANLLEDEGLTFLRSTDSGC